MSLKQTGESDTRSKIADNLTAGSLIEDRAERFDLDALKLDELHQAIALTHNTLSAPQISLRGAFLQAVQSLGAQGPDQKRKSEKAMDDLLFDAMLADMQARLDELEAELNTVREQMRLKYGDQFVQEISATFLSDDERAPLKKEDDLLRALADKMLDETGHIKAQYQNFEEADFIQKWQEVEQQRQLIEQRQNPDYDTALNQDLENKAAATAQIQHTASFNFA